MDKQKKIKIYELVANELRGCSDYTTVETLAERVGFSVKVTRQAISHAKKHLASEGIIIVNKMNHGYKVGSVKEFLVEIDKSCRRSLSHLIGMDNLVGLVRGVGGVDLSEILNAIYILKSNANRVETILSDYEAQQITPDFIYEPKEISRYN